MAKRQLWRGKVFCLELFNYVVSAHKPPQLQIPSCILPVGRAEFFKVQNQWDVVKPARCHESKSASPCTSCFWKRFNIHQLIRGTSWDYPGVFRTKIVTAVCWFGMFHQFVVLSTTVEGDAENGSIDASAQLRGFISAESAAPGQSAGHCRLLINTLKEQVLCNLMESKHLNCTPEVTRYVYIFQVKQERYFSASCLKVTQLLTPNERFYSRKAFVMHLLSWWSQITQLVQFFFMPLYTSQRSWWEFISPGIQGF